jgi:PhzF family phenazine biosynthesis protein
MSGYEILRYAAFTEDGAGGNPAGVVLDADELSDEERLAVAADLGYSESAFLDRRAPDGTYRTRYFSPLAEVDFCGHATVAAAVALADRGVPGPFVFETRVGPIAVATDATAGPVTATLTSAPTHSRPATDSEAASLLAALRIAPADLDPRYPLHVAFGGNDHPVVAVRGRATLAALDYDYPALAALMADRRWTTVHVVWAESPTLFHARDPFPPGGVVEDPATGAAAAAFGGYLRDLGLVPDGARITVRQGEDMGRPSRLVVHVAGGDRRVRVTGAAAPIAGKPADTGPGSRVSTPARA